MTLLSGLARKIVSWEVWGFPNIIHEIRIFARWWFTSKRLLRWRDDFTSKKFPICVMTTYLQKVFHVGVDDLHPRDFHICMTMTYIRKVSTFGVKVHIQEIPTRMAYIQDFSTLARWFTSRDFHFAWWWFTSKRNLSFLDYYAIPCVHYDSRHPKRFRSFPDGFTYKRFHVFTLMVCTTEFYSSCIHVYLFKWIPMLTRYTYFIPFLLSVSVFCGRSTT